MHSRGLIVCFTVRFFSSFQLTGLISMCFNVSFLVLFLLNSPDLSGVGETKEFYQWVNIDQDGPCRDFPGKGNFKRKKR